MLDSPENLGSQDGLIETMPEGATNIIFSVVVCTYNRSDCLANCLQSLAGQTADRDMFEVLVVDNNSSDDTRSVAHQFVDTYSHFRLLFEPCQGLSHARNRGWKNACGHYVAYIDDDATANPDWICTMADFITRQSDALIFGGPYDAIHQVPLPAWFPPDYGSMDLGRQERCIKLGSEWIPGTNMVIRRDLFLTYGGFDERLGMTGGKALYGEEVQFFLSMKGKGVTIYYVPAMRVSHLVAEYKMSLGWLLQSGYSIGRHYELTFNVERSLCSHLISFTVALCAAFFQMLRPVVMPVKRRIYYAFHGVSYEAGAIAEHLSTAFTRIKSHDV